MAEQDAKNTSGSGLPNNVATADKNKVDVTAGEALKTPTPVSTPVEPSEKPASLSSPSDAVAAPTPKTEEPAQTENKPEEPAGYPAKIVKSGHLHEGAEVQKGATVMVDIATYRWLLETGIGEPGTRDDAGYGVDKKGEVVKPESDEDAVARLEKEFADKQAKKNAETANTSEVA